MFIIQLRNGNFALMQSHKQGNPTMICECESYEECMRMRFALED